MRRLVGVLLLGLLAACSGSDPAPGPTSRTSWTVELDTAPTLLTLDAGSVYAASFGNGFGGSQVYRVDRATGRLVAKRTLAGQPNGLALGPRGEVWLSTVRLPDQPSGTALQVVDGRTLQTRRAVELPGRREPLGVAWVEGRLWVSTADGLHLLDPATGAALTSVPTAATAYRLLPAGARLVAVEATGLETFDARTGRRLAGRTVTAGGTVTAAVAGDLLWASYPSVDGARGVVERLDATTLRPVPSGMEPVGTGTRAAVTARTLWLADPAGTLRCADPRTGAVRAARDVPTTGAVAADATSVVVGQPRALRQLPAACPDR